MKSDYFEFKKDGLHINGVKIHAWDDLKIDSSSKHAKTKLTISIYGDLHGVDDQKQYHFVKPNE